MTGYARGRIRCRCGRCSAAGGLRSAARCPARPVPRGGSPGSTAQDPGRGRSGGARRGCGSRRSPRGGVAARAGVGVGAFPLLHQRATTDSHVISGFTLPLRSRGCARITQGRASFDARPCVTGRLKPRPAPPHRPREGLPRHDRTGPSPRPAAAPPPALRPARSTRPRRPAAPDACCAGAWPRSLRRRPRPVWLSRRLRLRTRCTSSASSSFFIVDRPSMSRSRPVARWPLAPLSVAAGAGRVRRHPVGTAGPVRRR
ncbi:hypothetical protein SGLAM104S_04080 [Streptomyces glaucescens]